MLEVMFGKSPNNHCFHESTDQRVYMAVEWWLRYIT
jgi:hypothetical protein